ncbi:MAG: polyisoprenoid-binding protein [Deltaproteobacteria bacterium]|nr:MAG: polyisoprenoid-binding protein [Deltaproteobacteria bacterium]
MIRKIPLLLLITLLSISTSFAETFQVDPNHTQIHFSVKHMVVFTARGNFGDFSGSVQVDSKKEILISAEATIQATSIDTGNSKRDNYLRSPDFFGVKQYPEIYFKSKKVTGSGDNITMVGDITIKGITKEIILKGSFSGTTLDPQGKLRARFTATGMINHKDFKLMGDKPTMTDKLTIGEEVKIRLKIESVVQ